MPDVKNRPARVRNAMTVDVEDYFMVANFADSVRFEDWPKFESRVEMSTRLVLDELDKAGVRATFFTLGWIAKRSPSLVRDIQRAGHEVACHGFKHKCIFDMTPAEFREDVRAAKSALEDITGEPVLGYRAASYSIVKETTWALDILIDEGFKYDSSIFPIRHDRYGIAGAKRFTHLLVRENGKIVEFPPTTVRLFGQNIPVGGGGYLRLLPLSFTRAAFRRINKREQRFAICYIHPWEVDPGQPRLNGSVWSRFRHGVNIDTTLPKLKGLLADFSFGPLSEFMPEAALDGQCLKRQEI